MDDKKSGEYIIDFLSFIVHFSKIHKFILGEIGKFEKAGKGTLVRTFYIILFLALNLVKIGD